MKDLFVIEGSLGKETIHGVKGLVRYILLVTFGFEFVGAVVLFWRFLCSGDYSIGKALGHAVFHSVSAFCNAGFSLYQDSLTRFASDGIVVFMFALLIFCGGLGFIVLLNINTFRFWKKDIFSRGKIKLQTKIVLTISLLLIFSAFVSLLFLEWDNTLRELSLKEKLLNGFFHSVTPRTAGFNTLNVARMGYPALWLFLFLMFIGASPGSTGGGIKTSTFMVLIANAYSIIKGKRDVHLYSRTIPQRVVQEATCILAISIGLIFLLTIGLLMTQKQADFIQIVFEVVSAFANVGLSLGITSGLTNVGKLIIIATMFIGRISPLAMALLVGRKEEQSPVVYPVESVMVG